MEVERKLAEWSDPGTAASPDSVWKSNHGNLLLCIVGVIVVLGTSVLACRQTSEVVHRFSGNLVYQEREQAIADFISEAEASDRRVVKVRILGAASDRGLMRLAIFTSPETFPDPAHAMDTDSWRISQGICEGHLAIPDVVSQVAIAAYHDENGNSQMDRNSLGVPSERYGFTNGVRDDRDGPPPYSAAAVDIDDKVIEISIR